MYLLSEAWKKPVSQKQIVEATGLSKGLVSRIMSWLIAKGVVKRPYRTRFVLEYPEKLLIDWIGQRDIGLKNAYFVDDAAILKRLKHTHTLFSGAWLDSGYLRNDITTVYVNKDFLPTPAMRAVEGKVADFKTKIVLIPAEDEFNFYAERKLKGGNVVNPFLLYVDLASLGGMGLTALQQVAEKHRLPQILNE
ncbi:MAG: helix-turn-helix domain-containing protein [Candidatus Micrarchaeota archaeon]